MQSGRRERWRGRSGFLRSCPAPPCVAEGVTLQGAGQGGSGLHRTRRTRPLPGLPRCSGTRTVHVSHGLDGRAGDATVGNGVYRPILVSSTAWLAVWLQHSVTNGGWSAVICRGFRGWLDVAGRSGRYYRAGHWVNRSSGKATQAKKSATGVVVVGLLVVGAWLGLFSHGSDASGTTPQPSPTSSFSEGR